MSNTDKALQLAFEALESIALAGMSGSGQESEEGLRDWHAKRAWEFIGIAARVLESARTSQLSGPQGAGGVPDLPDAFAAAKEGANQSPQDFVRGAQWMARQKAGATGDVAKEIDSIKGWCAFKGHGAYFLDVMLSRLVSAALSTQGAASEAAAEPSDEQIEAGAKKLADVFDYPWEHMPTKGRIQMRENVKAVLQAVRGKP